MSPLMRVLNLRHYYYCHCCGGSPADKISQHAQRHLTPKLRRHIDDAHTRPPEPNKSCKHMEPVSTGAVQAQMSQCQCRTMPVQVQHVVKPQVLTRPVSPALSHAMRSPRPSRIQNKGAQPESWLHRPLCDDEQCQTVSVTVCPESSPD